MGREAACARRFVISIFNQFLRLDPLLRIPVEGVRIPEVKVIGQSAFQSYRLAYVRRRSSTDVPPLPTRPYYYVELSTVEAGPSILPYPGTTVCSFRT
jgi:hypothetical protein